MHMMAQVAPSLVFHLAAQTRRPPLADLSDVSASIEQDLLGLLVLLSCAANATPSPQVFIRTGSLAEYGPGTTPARESQREQPLNAYAAALTAGSHYLDMLRPRLPFPAITARLALIYGPQQDGDFLVPQLIRKCLMRQPAEVRHPSDRRDLLFVADVCEALLCLAHDPPDHGLVNVSTGHAPSMRELALLIAGATGADPGLLSFGEEKGTGGIPDFRASPERLHGLTAWRPAVPVEEGLRLTVEWYRNELGKGQ
jgi:nucleoside-diphosphate-sugar epimerase